MNSGPSSKRRNRRERVRVTRACDLCKKKKLRCSGTLPCILCQRSNSTCEYTAGYTRGRLPPVPVPASQQFVNNNDVMGQQATPAAEGDGLTSPVAPPIRNTDEGSHLIAQHARNRIIGPSSRNSPEPHQTDSEGHYVGSSSGVSFLIRAQKRLHQQHMSIPPNTSIFSFGDAPLPKYDPLCLIVPSKSQAEALLNRYFAFAFPTHRFLHQKQAQSWLEQFYSNLNLPQSNNHGVKDIKALILMIFAQAKQSLPESDPCGANSADSAVFFAAAEYHLAAETGPARLTSVQARLAQCFYLLSESRINHCWSLFGITARLAIAIGLHRARRREFGGGLDLIEQECRKRVFWSAYSLDNYLSAALGRPRIFHDDEFDQELPLIVNDSQITAHEILPALTNAQSIMLAPVYHAKLSTIISSILRDLYGIQRASREKEVSAAAHREAELREWRHELSGFLDSPNVDLLMLTYQRQYTVLNLAFHHAQILLYRPFVLKNLSMPADKIANREDDQLYGTIDRYIRQCLEAATEVASIVRNLCEQGGLYHNFWFTHYYAFSAIAVLYVHFIHMCSQAVNIEQYLYYFQIGEQAQNDLATCSSRSPSVRRYLVVLEELREEAKKATKRCQQALGINFPISDPQRVNFADNVSRDDQRMEDQRQLNIPDIIANQDAAQLMALSQLQPEQSSSITGSKDDAYADSDIPNLAAWGDLDSLAFTGLGELDFTFPSELLPLA